jgi:hypothetical protein
VLNATPQNRTRNTVFVFIGWDLRWMREGGICTQMVHVGPAEHEWAIRGALIDEASVLTPEALALMALHELAHVFGVIAGDHKVTERDPDFWPKMRANIKRAISYRR